MNADTNRSKMSAPTPETDAETMQDEMDHVDSDIGPFAPSNTVPAEFARKLERERNEAIARSKEWSDWCVEYKREHDKAREELANIEALMFGGLVHYTPKNGLAWRVFDAVMAIKQERDKARENYLDELREALIAQRERDEAIEALDEAREDAAKWESSSDAMERAGAEQTRRAVENLEWALRVERERDEARAIAHDLAVIASHCLGWHDHESTDAAIRITAALKRWKKSK